MEPGHKAPHAPTPGDCPSLAPQLANPSSPSDLRTEVFDLRCQLLPSELTSTLPSSVTLSCELSVALSARCQRQLSSQSAVRLGGVRGPSASRQHARKLELVLGALDMRFQVSARL